MSLFNAVTIPFFGDPDVLRIEQRSLPTLAPNKVLVNVAAASVNPIDYKTRAGLGWAAAHNKENLPWVLGYDIAGLVTAVGDEACEHYVGQYVVGMIGFPYKGGAYSQCVAVDLNEVVRVPEHVNLQQAAGLPLAGLTAEQALTHGHVKKGQTVLVLGATGGVGHLVAQLAHIRGATVYATGSKKKVERLAKPLEHVNWVDVDNFNTDINSGSYDCVIDCVGGEFALWVISKLVNVSHWVTLPSLTADKIKTATASKGWNGVSYLVEPNAVQLNQLLTYMAEHKLTVHVDQIYPMFDVAKAHLALERGQHCGKVILSLD